MKKKILIGFCLMTFGHIKAQQVPTINSPTNAGQTSNEFWSRAGNNGNGNNIFGTKFNSPIYTVSGNGFGAGNTYRMKVNSIFSPGAQYPINGFNGFSGINTTGYILMGNNTTTGGQSIYQNKGAFSLLHLNGNDGLFVQEFGFRPWMKTGITFTDNQDLSYFGIRKVEPNSFDVTETTISWSDNVGSGFGPR